MRKILLTAVLLGLTFCFGALPAWAVNDYGYEEGDPLPDNFFQLYRVDNSLAPGIKYRFWQRFYATTNIEYCQDDRDLLFQAGMVYTVPHEIVFLKIEGRKVLYLDFYFYGGGGAQFSRDKGYHYPYIVMGLHCLFFFAETVYPWADEKPVFRSGFSFKM